MPYFALRADAWHMSSQSNLAAERVADGQETRFDFSAPRGLERTQLRQLQLTLETYTRRAGSVLSATLRTRVQMELVSLKERDVAAFAAGVDEQTSLLLFAMPPLAGRAMLALPLPLAMALVDLRLGGAGTSTAYPERALTEIEKGIFGPVGELLLADLPVALTGLVPCGLGNIVHESGQYLQHGSSADRCLVVSLTMQIGAGEAHPYDLMLPFTMVRSLVDAMERMSGAADEGPRDTQAVAERLLDVYAEASIRFLPTRLTSAEILGLTPGDVVRLPHPEGAPLQLAVGGLPLMHVSITQRGKRVVCTVIGKMEKHL
ncbi:flagellar motor switch protein FliM [Acidothermaceae bacterium B102]|nr:flagellar motor switch protein FliM [Acidothermaceae bacterium B102]